MLLKSRAFLSRVTLTFLAIVIFLYAALHIYTAPRVLNVASTDNKPTYRRFNSTSPLPKTPFAIATFLTGQGTDLEYLNSTRILTYQLLHNPNTRVDTSKITWIVACSSSLPVNQKQILERDGAIVVEIDDVKTNWWIKTEVRRWKEQFTKLRLFEMIEYQRILFMDADTLILQPLGEIFQEPELADLQRTFAHGWPNDGVKDDEAELPDEWLFAARSDNGYGGQRGHPIPPLNSAEFSAGFWVVSPNKKVFEHMMSVMAHYKRFKPFTMEQSMLNYVYRRNGPMPWRELNWKWSATWPDVQDRDRGVATLHDKLWNNGPQELQDIWHRQQKEMLEFFGKREEEG